MDKVSTWLIQQPNFTGTIKDMRAALNMPKTTATRTVRNMTAAGQVERNFQGGTQGGRHTITLVRMQCPMRDEDKHGDDCYYCQGAGSVDVK